MQIAYSFDSESLKKIGKGALIAAGGALCTYLLENLSQVNFGAYTPILVAVFSILINSVKEHINGVQ
jgi:hypothetical protein